MKIHKGDRFEKEMYGYEATTILEKFWKNPQTSAITFFLKEHAFKNHFSQDSKIIEGMISEIMNILEKDL